MDRVKSSIIQLVNKSLNNNKIQNLDLSEDEWGLLFNEAVSHQIHLLIFNNAVKCHDIPKELHDKWLNIYRLSVIRSICILSILPGIFEKFNENKLSVMLLKGPYLRDLYPEPDTRIMGDIDLFVDKMQLNETVNVINSFGYIMVEDDPTDMHYKFIHKKYIPIELHYSLVRASNFEYAEELNKTIWDGANKYSYENTYIFVPSDVNMAIYVCFHMANHYKYTGGGFGIRQLCDLVLLLNKKFDEEKWKLFIEKINELGLGDFATGLLAVCKKYLYLVVPDSILQILDMNNELIDTFFDIIYKSGLFGASSAINSANKALAQYSKDGSVISYFFPPREKLSDAYSYARKNKFLLPVAWIHRLINNVFRRDISLSNKMPKRDIIDKYSQLSEWLKI